MTLQHFCRIRNGLQRVIHTLHDVSLGIAGAIINVHGHIREMLQGIDGIDIGRGYGLHIATAATAVTSVSAEKPVKSHKVTAF